jgi:hypothetical protein
MKVDDRHKETSKIKGMTETRVQPWVIRVLPSSTLTVPLSHWSRQLPNGTSVGDSVLLHARKAVSESASCLVYCRALGPSLQVPLPPAGVDTQDGQQGAAPCSMLHFFLTLSLLP